MEEKKVNLPPEVIDRLDKSIKVPFMTPPEEGTGIAGGGILLADGRSVPAASPKSDESAVRWIDQALEFQVVEFTKHAMRSIQMRMPTIDADPQLAIDSFNNDVKDALLSMKSDSGAVVKVARATFAALIVDSALRFANKHPEQKAAAEELGLGKEAEE